MTPENASEVPWIQQTRHLFEYGAPDPDPGETYRCYLDRCGILDHGFAYDELVNGSRRHEEPAIGMWVNFPLTLAVALELRRQALMCGAAKGVRVAAAYRPAGGSRKSRHKSNRALDLDRIGGDGVAWYELAVRMWCALGPELGLGLGLYAPPKARGGMRIHVDTGTTCRSWQGIGTTFGRPWRVGGSKVGLAMSVADELGLRIPTEQDQ